MEGIWLCLCGEMLLLLLQSVWEITGTDWKS
jgi:hypothetical protein